MTSMRDMLGAESLKALEQLGRSPAHEFREQRHQKPPARKVPQQKRLPFILGVIRSVGCDTIYFEDRSGLTVVGLVIAHWTKEELAFITEAIETSRFMYRKTWRNTWAVVLTC